MTLNDIFDNPQKSLTIVVIIAAIGVLAALIVGFFFAAKSAEIVSAALKIFETILVGAVSGKLALAIPGNSNNKDKQ